MSEYDHHSVRSLSDLLKEEDEEDLTSIKRRLSESKESTPKKPNINGTGDHPHFKKKTKEDAAAIHLEEYPKKVTKVPLESPSEEMPSVSFQEATKSNEAADKTSTLSARKGSVITDTFLDVSRRPSIMEQLSITSDKEPEKPEIKLKVFVGFLFIVMVTGVSATLALAKEKQLMVELGKNIVFNEESRVIRMKYDKRMDVLVGELGVELPFNQYPHDCSKEQYRKSHLCLKWKQKAQLDIDYWENGTRKCYLVSWKSLHKDTILKDCFNLTSQKVHWYGGSLKSDQKWPLKGMSVPLSSFITGELDDEEAFGPVVEPYWLSSSGVSIFSSDISIPLHVSLNSTIENSTKTDERLCLRCGPTNPLYQYHNSEHLSYTVCLGKDILDVQLLSQTKVPDVRNITLATAPDMGLFKDATLSVYPSLQNEKNQADILSLANHIKNKNISIGLLVMDDQWQRISGDFTFDEAKFTNGGEMVKELNDMGYKVALGVSPYISVQSENIINMSNDDYLVKDAGGLVPGIIKTNTFRKSEEKSNLYTVLDITSTKPNDWFLEWRAEFQRQFGINHIYYQGGMSTLLPYGARFEAGSTDLNLFNHQYGNLGLEGEENFIIVDSAVHLQGNPLIIHLNVYKLESAIPIAFNLGLFGYPYFMFNMADTKNGNIPSKDLYIRGVQLSTFFPVMLLSDSPDLYDEETVAIVRDMIKIHQNFVYPRLLNHTENSNMFEPFIKPLWWVDPGDNHALTIDTEFIVGSDVLVAPILEEKSTSRDVFIPRGSWQDHQNKKTYSGPTFIKDYQVNLNQVAYFFKL